MWELILAIVAIAALVCGRFYNWARRESVSRAPAMRRVVLVAEALGYVGAMAFLAGSIAVIVQREIHVSDRQHVLAYAAAGGLFLLGGFIARKSRKPKVKPLAGILWFLSVGSFAGAVIYSSGTVPMGRGTTLAVGVAISLCSAFVWLAERRALENITLFAGLVLTICGAIGLAASPPPLVAYALILWMFGLLWAWAGWREYIEPGRLTLASGVALALIAPSFAAGEYGSLYVIGIATAGAAMVASGPLQNASLLVLGTLAASSYAAWAVIRYFHEPLGIAAAVAITGVLIIVLAVVNARQIHSVK